jgi:hypothetical protein
MEKKIKELLDKRDILSDMAEVLYGEFWVANDEFYNSPTEKEMREVMEQLYELGYENPDINDDTKALGQIILDELAKKGIILDEDDIPKWWEDEDEDDDDNWFV